MKPTKKQQTEFKKLIIKARELDEEFMQSSLPIRLEFNLSFSPKYNKWVNISNCLFRTRLPNSKNEHDINTKEVTLELPTIITRRHKGFNKWKNEIEEPMSITLKEIFEKYGKI